MSLKQFVKRLRREVTDAAWVRHNARELRTGEGAENFVVVHAEHGDLLRNGEARLLANFEDGAAAKVVAGQNAHGFGQRLEPGSQSHPVPGRVFALQNGASRAQGTDTRDKLLSAPVGPLEARIAAIGEMPESSLHKMLHGQVADGTVIQVHVGHSRWGAVTGDVDHRNPFGQERPGDACGLETGDDAVAAP